MGSLSNIISIERAQMTGFATYPTLRNRHVIITGGATGIGAAMVSAFSAQGSRVSFLDLHPEPAADLIRSIPENPPAFHPCDLTDPAQLRESFTAILSTHGPADVLINNAADDTRHTLDEVTPEFWDRTIAVNLKHQFFAAKAVIPGMKQQNHGSIINMSSISWLIPSTGLPVYIAAKAAIVGLTRTLAHELGPSNIRVNAVLPGAIATDRQQRLVYTEAYVAQILERQALKRLIQPEEVARLVLFLAADDSSAITNQSHIIDAGWV